MNLSGRDYVHLTLEDLINSYEMWSTIDESKLPVFEEMIRSKADYLDKNNLGYTTKIKKALSVSTCRIYFRQVVNIRMLFEVK